MDAWTDLPGARVDGHRAVVRGSAESSQVECECSYRSSPSPTVERSCQLLVDHLQQVVRFGAAVLFEGEEGGAAGVREPRRPLSPLGSLDAFAERDGTSRTA